MTSTLSRDIYLFVQHQQLSVSKLIAEALKCDGVNTVMHLLWQQLVGATGLLLFIFYYYYNFLMLEEVQNNLMLHFKLMIPNVKQ